MSKIVNEPAYPFQYSDATGHPCITPGMPTRLVIAMHAMQGILASCEEAYAGFSGIAKVVEHSLEYADALLAEHAKEAT